MKRETIPLYKVHMPPGVDEALRDVLYSGMIAEGAQTRRFEAALASYLGNPRLVSAGDISSALTLCLFLAGVRPGDEVLASPIACLATNMPALNLFARVVWCDIDPETGGIAPEDVEARITPATKAILYAHWAGMCADVRSINRVAARHDLRVVEDAGEALGAEYEGKKIGNTGSDFVAFSFHAIRHITTGEGAAITFAREADLEQARWIKRYGIHQPTFRDALGEIDPASDIPVPGYNSYMTNIAATLGLAQLPCLDEIVGRHRSNGEFYDRELASSVTGVRPLRRYADSRPAYWVHTLLADRRDDLLRRLREKGIYASRVHLRNDNYSCFGSKVDYPGVTRFTNTSLSIPSGWWVTDEERQYIVQTLREGW